MSDRKVNVLYVGDNIETISIMHVGYDFVFNNHSVTEERLDIALRSDPEIHVDRIWGTAVDRKFPNTMKELSRYDVVVLSDVGSDTLVLSSELMSGSRVTDRLKLIRDFVRNGGGLLMNGGYWSFGGFRGIARYHDTPVEEALPVYIKDGDDRVEVPDGFKPSIIMPDHPVVARLDWMSDFYFLGYNKLKIKGGAELLAKYLDDPIIAVQSFGKGRSMAFASDCDLHWGGSFIAWPHYSKFWCQAIKWLANIAQ
jgi:uncharacterized membrane protein